MQFILDYCKHHGLYSFSIDEMLRTDLFTNTSINRKLSAEVAKEIMTEMVNQKQAEIKGDRFLVFWKKPEEVGESLWKISQERGLSGTLCTVYEMLRSDAYKGEFFHAVDERLFMLAIEYLEKSGRVQLLRETGTSFDELGIKFK